MGQSLTVTPFSCFHGGKLKSKKTERMDVGLEVEALNAGGKRAASGAAAMQAAAWNSHLPSAMAAWHGLQL